MQMQRINRTDAEKIFTIVQNVSAATISAGAVVAWDISSSIDGVRVSKPVTATLSCVVGITTESIVDSAYGKIQTYGYNSSVYVTADTSVAVTAGNLLLAMNAAHHLGTSTTSDGKSGFFYAGVAVATQTTPAAAVTKVLIRCL